MGDDNAMYYLLSHYDGQMRFPLDESLKRHILGRGSVQDKNIPGKVDLGIPSSEAGISRFQAMIRTQVGPEKKVIVRTSDKAKNPTRVVRDEGRTTLYLRPGEQSVIVVGDRIELDSYNYTSDYSYVLRAMGDSDDEPEYESSDDGKAGLAVPDEERKEEDVQIELEGEDDEESIEQPQSSSAGIAGLFGGLFGSSEREEQKSSSENMPMPSRRASAPISTTIFRSIFGGEEEEEPSVAAAEDPATLDNDEEQPAAPAPQKARQQPKKKDSRRRKSDGSDLTRPSGEASQQSSGGLNPTDVRALTAFLKEAHLAVFTLTLIEHGVDSVSKVCEPAFLNDDDRLESYGFKRAQIIKLRRAAAARA